MEVTDENQRVVVPKYSLAALVSSLVDTLLLIETHGCL